MSVPVAYAAVGERSSPLFCQAFAIGCGGRVVDNGRLQPGPVAMFGSAKLWDGLQQARAEGRDWYYGDHAYFWRVDRLGLESGYFRVTRNAYQHDGRGHAKLDRFAKLGIEIRPWRKSGRHILLCPPDEAFGRLMGIDAWAWKVSVIARLSRYTDRPIIVRERTAARRNVSLAADLMNCWAMVTFMSNAGVEAILAGIPAIALGDCAARGLCGDRLDTIEEPPMPDWREQWAANLAANQWTLREIAAGDCWRAIGRPS